MGVEISTGWSAEWNALDAGETAGTGGCVQGGPLFAVAALDVGASLVGE